MKKEKLEFDPESQHIRCIAHVLNLSVQDFLTSLQDRIRFERELLLSKNSQEIQAVQKKRST
jgi:hypothetical protein